MDYVSDKKMKIFLKGAGIGLTGSLVSATSGAITGRRLGYSPVGIVSTFKVALTTGLSALVFLKVYNELESMNSKKPTT